MNLQFNTIKQIEMIADFLADLGCKSSFRRLFSNSTVADNVVAISLLISSIMQELRGGAWPTALIKNTIFVVVLDGIWLSAFRSECFVQQSNLG